MNTCSSDLPWAFFAVDQKLKTLYVDAGRWQVTSIVSWQTGYPILMWDDSNDLSGTNEGPGNASSERWNIEGDPRNLKWSATGVIPHFENTMTMTEMC